MFKETLLPLEDGAFLALTLDGRPSHELQVRQLDLAYARECLPSGSSRDVLALVTEPLPADRKLSAKHLNQAKSQDQAAELYAGKKYEINLRENAARERALAEQALLDSRRLPTNAWYLGDRQVLLEYQEHPLPRWYRIVSLANDTELARFDANALCKAVQSKPFEVPVPAGPPLKFGVLAARGDHVLVDGGLTRAVLQRRTDGFARLALVGCMYGGWRAGAATPEGFVCEIQPEMGRHELLYFDLTRGGAVSRWPCKRRVATSFATPASADAPVAFCSFGGDVSLLDTHSGAVHTIPAFLGLGKDDTPDLRLTPDARYVVIFPWYGKRFGVFDIATQACVVLDVPEREVVEINGLRQQRTPDVAVTTSELVTLTRGQLDRIPWSNLAWQSPPVAAPRLKKGKTPLDTIFAATATGPLKPIATLIRSWYAPSIALCASKQRKDLAVGLSKFNGTPDLAQGVTWPRWRGTPMAFLAQIDCAAVRLVAPEIALPDSGLLSFFLGLDPDYPIPSFYGDVNTDPGGARVLYTPKSSVLTRLAMPEDMPSEYVGSDRPVCKLKLTRGGAVLPAVDNPVVALAGLTPVQAQHYLALAEFVNGEAEDEKHMGSRLGGHPSILQNDTLQLTAESFERGDGSLSGRGWEQLEFQRASAEWCQLMQMAGGEEEWIWGDGGLMHWMVRKSEFAAADFSSAWAIGVN